VRNFTIANLLISLISWSQIDYYPQYLPHRKEVDLDKKLNLNCLTNCKLEIFVSHMAKLPLPREQNYLRHSVDLVTSKNSYCRARDLVVVSY